MNYEDGLVNHWFSTLKSRIWQGAVSTREVASGQRSRSHGSNAPGHAPPGVFWLSATQIGDRVRIVALNCGDASSRLMGMGLIPGAILEVISCTATGSMIVALQDHRLGLGADMAQQIQVIPVDQSMDTDQVIEKYQSLHQDSGATSANLVKVLSMSSRSESSTVKLRNAAIGSRLKVVGYEPTSRDYKRKLLAMGLTPGTELRVTRHAPLGDPTEIEVRDFHLSPRKDEADALIVTPIPGEQP